jgi:signal peptidase I
MIKKHTTGIDVGDVVVLEHPDREGTVCKRVLGLPGDIIIRPKNDSYYSSKHRDVMEVFDDDSSDGYAASLSDSSLEVVPDGHIWVEGDNSVNSADSRHYGPVSSALIVGKVWFRIWPLRGDAFMVRGGRPMPPKHAPFTGSTVIPAGCEGEKIISS